VHDAVEIIAHRGYSGKAPENTLASLEAAVVAGADAVEFDLHTAACGTPVLFHDDMLSRTTNGVGPVRRRTLVQLKTLDAGKWFAPEFAGERIPSFEEALALLDGRIGRIYAEVKGYREFEDLDRMVDIVRKLGMMPAVTFISMNWMLLDRMRSREPELAVGYIVDGSALVEESLQRAAGDPRALVDLRADLVADDPAVIARASRDGTDLAVWTVDDPVDAQRILDAGVRRITSNQVDALLVWKRSL
jgi:glycerophosphoryl diester phosphodiesterase